MPLAWATEKGGTQAPFAVIRLQLFILPLLVKANEDVMRVQVGSARLKAALAAQLRARNAHAQRGKAAGLAEGAPRSAAGPPPAARPGWTRPRPRRAFPPPSGSPPAAWSPPPASPPARPSPAPACAPPSSGAHVKHTSTTVQQELLRCYSFQP